MTEIITENDLSFDFTKAVAVIKLDDTIDISNFPSRLKSVDFIVEWEQSFWFVEVKDPLNPKIPLEHKKSQEMNFSDKLQSNELFTEELGPKLKDSFFYCLLENLITFEKSLHYLALITSIDQEEAGYLSSKFEKSCYFPGPQGRPWQRADLFINSPQLFNLESWNWHHPKCPVKRLSNA